MKEEILNNGLDNYERKQDSKVGVFFILTVSFSIAIVVCLATIAVKSNTIKAYENKIKQQEELIKALAATNNELVNDNLNLSHGK